MFTNEKIDMRVKYTREWTFEALVRLCTSKAYNDISISEIINKAGISRATFYRNFDSKEDIIEKKALQLFNDFYTDIIDYYKENQPENELFLIQAFFHLVDEQETFIDLVIAANVEYVMTYHIYRIITAHNKMFYPLVKTKKKTETYTMDLVASSVWAILSRWHKTDKQETADELAKIFMGAFRNIYFALFEDKAQIGE